MPRPTVHRLPFGTAPGGTAVDLWRLDSGTGVHAEILTYGGILHRLVVPDTRGRAASVVLSLPTLDQYAEKSRYLGALVGRYANRIAHGRFTLDGTEHRIPVNDRGHALHGGPDGFDRRVWHAEPAREDGCAALRLTLHSPDGDMGFPGALDVTATYRLDGAGTLALDWSAATDRPTVVNLTNHAYFNLAEGPDILGHDLAVDADAYLPVDTAGIPAGGPQPVAGTAFDLTAARSVGVALARPDRQLREAGGLDHCWVLRPSPGRHTPRRAARLTAPGGLRTLEVWTTEPGLQVYTGNQLDGSLVGPGGRVYGRHAAVCLETQHFPDAPNRPDFPATVLRPGEVLASRTEYRFPHLS
ncbi:aldose epimerase family protein [Kitasatospora sp. NPDC059571]|uniref:aldose epimerase family protein n=1 Tax=Kitasatospora sp. NPDC059571 TaxID=3346871 RepID=UPI0036C69B3A